MSDNLKEQLAKEDLKFIKLKEVMESTTLSKSTIYAYVSEGRFPRPITLGLRSVAWIESEVNSWKSEQVALRDQEAV